MPKVFIFPRVTAVLMVLHPAGGQVAFLAGRMKAEHFLKLVKHFASHVKPANEGPVLVLWNIAIRICQSPPPIAVRKMA